MVYSEISKTDKTKILISLDTVNGVEFGQIRIWTKVNDELIPTKKGVSFGLALLPDIQVALERMRIDGKLKDGDTPHIDEDDD